MSARRTAADTAAAFLDRYERRTGTGVAGAVEPGDQAPGEPPAPALAVAAMRPDVMARGPCARR
jgi:hypothetical protein